MTCNTKIHQKINFKKIQIIELPKGCINFYHRRRMASLPLLLIGDFLPNKFNIFLQNLNA